MKALSEFAFRIQDFDGAADDDALLELFRGNTAAVHIRNALSPESSLKLVNAFLASSATTMRKDGVPGYVLGAYHYGKSFESYRDDVIRYRQAVHTALGEDDPVAAILRSIASALSREQRQLRPARWHDLSAAYARFLSWHGTSEYLLLPHDDSSQLSDPRQHNFEASRTGPCTFAINIYPQVPAGIGGHIRLWNEIPDERDRERFHVQHTGYPYPTTAVADRPFIDVKPETGSCIVMNGSLVHAVLGYPLGLAEGERRVLINLFLGHLNKRTTIHWV